MKTRLDRILGLVAKRRIRKAIAELQQALSRKSRRSHYYLCLVALCHANLGHRRCAERFAWEAVAHAPYSAWAYLGLAQVYAWDGNLPFARAVTEIGLMLDPALSELHAVQAEVEFKSGDMLAAAQAAERGLALKPTERKCRDYLTLALARLERN
ncbi:MAG: hypothetical protein HYY24_26260 [Verrucomicrobia bacterium]|nr:hypothetical protein [Verrucomicrobiota bacterium]